MGAEEVGPDQLAAVSACLHDRMTQTVVDSNFDGAALFESLPGKPTRRIDVLGVGKAALDEANQVLGQIGRAHVCTPVTNAHLVCRLLLEKKKYSKTQQVTTNQIINPYQTHRD